MDEGLVGVVVHFTAGCPACGRDMQCSGGQTLVYERLTWSLDCVCLSCGATVVCGREDIPASLRERILNAHGPARLQLAEGADHPAVVMKVIRTELGLDLRETREMLRIVRSSQHTGTMPEIEQFARSLRAVGVEARAVRP